MQESSSEETEGGELKAASRMAVAIDDLNESRGAG